MRSLTAYNLASCRTFSELAQLLAEAQIYDHEFAGCLLAEIGEDARIREVGRYGMMGPGPSSDSVPLWDTGLIAKALKQQKPSLITDAQAAARSNLLTPGSDIDEIVLVNEFESLIAIPLRHGGLLKGVIGLASMERIEGSLSANFDYLEFQSLMRLATRAIAYGLGQNFSPAAVSTKKLSDRESALISLIARGLTNQEIARELSLSVPTVKLGVSSLIKRFSAGSRHNVLDKARLEGLLG